MLPVSYKIRAAFLTHRGMEGSVSKVCGFAFLRSFVRRLNMAMGYIAGLGIFIMGLILFYEVIARYVIGKPTVWSQEISLYIFIWAMLGSAGYTLAADKHIAIDFITTKLSPRMQYVTGIAAALAGTIFSAIISWQAWEMLEKTLRFGRLSPTPLAIPLWLVHSSVLVGFGLLTLQYIFILLDKCCPSKQHTGTGDSSC